MGQLWLAGVEIDWRALHGELPRRRVALPTYPFERKRHWVEPYQPTVSRGTYTNGNGVARDTNGAISGEMDAQEQELNVTQTAVEPSTEVEALIQEQLRIMAQQIEVLSLASGASGQTGRIRP